MQKPKLHSRATVGKSPLLTGHGREHGSGLSIFR